MYKRFLAPGCRVLMECRVIVCGVEVAAVNDEPARLFINGQVWDISKDMAQEFQADAASIVAARRQFPDASADLRLSGNFVRCGNVSIRYATVSMAAQAYGMIRRALIFTGYAPHFDKQSS